MTGTVGISAGAFAYFWFCINEGRGCLLRVDSWASVSVSCSSFVFVSGIRISVGVLLGVAS